MGREGGWGSLRNGIASWGGGRLSAVGGRGVRRLRGERGTLGIAWEWDGFLG